MAGAEARLLLLAAAWSAVCADPDAELLLTVILARHGARSPPAPLGSLDNLTREVLADFTARDLPPVWPDGGVWGTRVTAGLTPHGAEHLRLMGDYMRQQRLQTLQGQCDRVALYADTTAGSLSVDSAMRWSQAAFPLCPRLHYPSALLADDVLSRELFNAGQFPASCDRPNVSGRIGPLGGSQAVLSRSWRLATERVDRVLGCCPERLCRDLGVPAPCNLSELGDSPRGTFGLTDYWSDFFLCEALNGNPTFAGGVLSFEEVVDLYRVNLQGREHTLDQWAAPAFGSALLGYLAASLHQASTLEQVEGVRHDAKTKLVYMSVQDTNLLMLRRLLELEWLPLGWPRNAVPVGSMLIFQLYRRGQTDYVQVSYEAALPEQLRERRAFEGGEEPGRVAVPVPGCTDEDGDGLCPLRHFLKVVGRRSRAECAGRGIPEFLRGLAEGSEASVCWVYGSSWAGGMVFGAAAVLLTAIFGYGIRYRK